LNNTLRVISGFHCALDENCALLRHYAASNCDFFYLRFGTTQKPEDGTDRLSRNVGNKLPLSLRNIPKERSS